MGKLGVVDFHPQAAFTQEQRVAVIAYLKEKVKGQRGRLDVKDMSTLRAVIVCKDPWGRSVLIRGRFKQVYDFRVTMQDPKVEKVSFLKIKPGAGPGPGPSSSSSSAIPSS